MSEETEALHEQEAAYIYRLAEDLEIDYCGDVVAHNAAAELCRLSAENNRLHQRHRDDNVEYTRVLAQRDLLLEALRWTARALDHDHPAAIKARAAIKAAEGENHAKNL